MSIEAKLSRLSLQLKNAQSPKSSKASVNRTEDETPDSWDDVDENDEPVEAPGPSLKHITSNDNPAPPPPTPISSQAPEVMARRWEASASHGTGVASARSTPPRANSHDRRPEKTTSTANRMIAGALGLKSPKSTEEQRQYDRAVKEAEIKRRNREKEQQAQQKVEDDRARVAMWDN